MATIAVPGTLDTHGREHVFVAERIRDRGHPRSSSTWEPAAGRALHAARLRHQRSGVARACVEALLAVIERARTAEHGKPGARATGIRSPS